MATRGSAQRIIVIGGGIAGCSAAYHLATLGMTNVRVFDRPTVGPEAWRSSIDWRTLWPGVPCSLRNYAAAWYQQLESETGHNLRQRAVGRVLYTDSEDRWQRMRDFQALARVHELRADLLSAAEVASLLPLSADGLIGGVWLPGDSSIAPSKVRGALVKALRARGVGFHADEVLGIKLSNGDVQSVETAQGEMTCDVVVVAAGPLSANLVRSCGLALPLLAFERHYVVTPPCGMAHDLPLFASFDDQIYGGEHAGGLVVGNHHHTRPGAADALTARTECRLDQCPPYLQAALARFPALRTTPFEILKDNSEAFTPDSLPLLGPIPGATHLYAACGFNANGMSLAPAAGRCLAEWIVGGYPRVSISAFDTRRFTPPQATASYLQERVAEVLSFRYRLRTADADYQTSRNVACSPLHDRLHAAGAHFASVNAWERALWVQHAPRNSHWLTAVAEELRAALEGVLVVDRSADFKCSLMGPGVVDWFDATAPLWLRGSFNTTIDLRPLPGDSGRTEALVRTRAHGADCVSFSATPDQEAWVREWLRRTRTPAGLIAHDKTTEFALLEFYGPQRRTLLGALDRAGHKLPESYVREDTFTNSTAVAVPVASAARIWDALQTLGSAHGLAIGGYFAEEALRIKRGLPAFGREITALTTLDALRAMASGDDEPLWESSRIGAQGQHVLGAFTSSATAAGFGSGELLLAGDRPIGELTSRVHLPGWPQTLALGLLDFSLWRGEKLYFVAHGQKWPLTPRESPWHVALRRDGSS